MLASPGFACLLVEDEVLVGATYWSFGNPPVTVIADDPIRSLGSPDSDAPLLFLHERYHFGPIAFKDLVRLCYINPEFYDPCQCPLLTRTRVASSPRFRAGAGRLGVHRDWYATPTHASRIRQTSFPLSWPWHSSVSCSSFVVVIPD